MREILKVITGTKYNICVNFIKENNLNGEIYHKYSEFCIPFHSSIELFHLLEKEMDRIGYPQDTTQKRFFKSQRHQRHQSQNTQKELELFMKDNDVLDHKGSKATFVIEIKYRENSTWQGTVNWVEGNQTQNFRSALELIRLMDDVTQE